MAASFRFLLLSVVCLVVASQTDPVKITAETKSSITLPCEAAQRKPVEAAEWNRTGLGPNEFVIFFKGGKFEIRGQAALFKDRVSLKDKDQGDVSLILKNLTLNDTGRYECRVQQRTNTRRKRSNLDSEPISIIDLIVLGREDDRWNGDTIGLIVGLLVGFLFLGCIAFFAIRLRKRRSTI